MSIYSYYDADITPWQGAPQPHGSQYTGYQPAYGQQANTPVPSYKQSSDQPRVAPIVFCVLQFIALILSVLGVCFDQYKPHEVIQQDAFGCISLWSFKMPGENCITGKNFELSSEELFSVCKTRSQKVKAAGGLGIAGIILIFIALVVGGAAICTGVAALRFVCVGINVLAFIFLCVTWALVAYMFNNGEDLSNESLQSGLTPDELSLVQLFCSSFKSFNDAFAGTGFTVIKYGSGFGLLIAAWGMVLINTIVVVLPC
ncbi:amastin-like protein [Angomonas deanei]|uniref:Amastin surface glycoprotein, putative n=1 Tax=Angomonas deanei TaxID=59799 RepID=A0A7G2BZR8_9TRYP|nr:amastin-like protein [Angomonas deanei]CAD2213019.1 Amastin surface glycoprotein, putative [Angomonas deanei]|eukprot:EPY15664.1 amastin-like protein [Angomonas deanei]